MGDKLSNLIGYLKGAYKRGRDRLPEDGPVTTWWKNAEDKKHRELGLETERMKEDKFSNPDIYTLGTNVLGETPEIKRRGGACGPNGIL